MSAKKFLNFLKRINELDKIKFFVDPLPAPHPHSKKNTAEHGP